MNPFLHYFSGGGGGEGQYLAIEQGFCFIYFIILYFILLLFILFLFLSMIKFIFGCGILYVISYPWS